jgi:hypothetical protein
MRALEPVPQGCACTGIVLGWPLFRLRNAHVYGQGGVSRRLFLILKNRYIFVFLPLYTAAFMHVLVLLAAGFALCFGESINLT